MPPRRCSIDAFLPVIYGLVLGLIPEDQAAAGAGVPPKAPKAVVSLSARNPTLWDGAQVHEVLAGRGAYLVCAKLADGGWIIMYCPKAANAAEHTYTACSNAVIGFCAPTGEYTLGRIKDESKAVFNNTRDLIYGAGHDLYIPLSPEAAGTATMRPLSFDIQPPNHPVYRQVQDWQAQQKIQASAGDGEAAADAGKIVFQLRSLQIFLVRDFVASLHEFKQSTAPAPVFSLGWFERTLRSMSNLVLPKDRTRINVAVVSEVGNGKSTFLSKLFGLFNERLQHVCPSGAGLASGVTHTTRLQVVPINARGNFTGMTVMDTAGCESTPGHLAHTCNLVKYMINGHLDDGYDMRMGQPEGSGAPGFCDAVTPDDVLDVLVIIVAFDRAVEATTLELVQAIRHIVEVTHRHRRVQLLVLMTKGDKLVPMLLEKPWLLLEEPALKAQMLSFVEKTGLAPDRVIPVVAFDHLDKKGFEHKVPILHAMESIYNAAMTRAAILENEEQCRAFRRQ